MVVIAEAFKELPYNFELVFISSRLDLRGYPIRFTIRLRVVSTLIRSSILNEISISLNLISYSLNLYSKV